MGLRVYGPLGLVRAREHKLRKHPKTKANSTGWDSS